MRDTWQPSRDYIDRANVTRFMLGNRIPTVEELRERSLDIEWFWDAVVKDCAIEFSRPYDSVIDGSEGIAWTRWFTNGRINIAHNCVDRWAERIPDGLALVWEGEDGEVRRVTFGELRALSDKIAGTLRLLGVRSRDVVGIFMPMAPETVAVMYACTKMGAIALPIFSGFAAGAVGGRLRDGNASVLVTADGFWRRGSIVRMKEVADEALRQAPSVRTTLVWPRLGRKDVPWERGRDLRWEEIEDSEGSTTPTEPLDSEHPALLMYTSGTTGRSKGAIHVHGGLLANVAKDVGFHLDLQPRDTIFWVTDIGWIMGPWILIGAGFFGATAFLYEGAPTYPRPNRLWEMIERHRITFLGLSPSLINACSAMGREHVRPHDLSSLRILGAAGEPLGREAYGWLYEEIGRSRCPIMNISGGTEVGGLFLAPLPISDIKACSLGGPALGMDVDVLGEDGRPVLPGEKGELVCMKAWPGMTRGLWNDSTRYLRTYWSIWPGMWLHGDWASFDEEGFWFLHGRSDDTLNIAGKRLGPAEVEDVLAQHPAVAESAAISVPNKNAGQAIWCFVILERGRQDLAQLGEELGDHVALGLGKPFRPERVVFVSDLPKTRSAKILRRVIRATVLGENPGDLSSVENTSSIESIRATVGRPA